MKTWVVVANRAVARLFERGARHAPLVEIEDAFNPRGRAHDRDIDADRPGRAFERAGAGRHAMSREESAAERAAGDFARAIAARLERARKAQECDELILVAEPRFLGRLRAALDDATAAIVGASVDKDVVKLDADDIARTLEATLNP